MQQEERETEVPLITSSSIRKTVITNLHNEEKETIPPRLKQMYVALGPILITISLGMAEGYSAILLPQLEEENQMPIDKETASWIASMTALPMAIGCVLGGYGMEVIGRKTVHMLTCIPCVIGWLIIYYAFNVEMILAGRFLTGFCVGLLGPPTGVYMSETSDPKFRGFLLASISFAIAFGIFLSHLLGTYLTWQDTALICCSFPVVCVIVMIFAPESPTFLAKIKKIEEAKKAFYWCRGSSAKAKEELEVLIDRQTKLTEEPKKNVREYLRDLQKTEFWKPLIIIIIFFLTMQWAGNNAFSFYGVTIMKQTMGNNFDEYLSMLILDTIRLLTSIVACVMSKKFGRRPLAIASGVGTFVALFVLSAFIFATRYTKSIEGYTFIPMTALVVYIFCITFGFVPLPWTMMGEVFPLANRGMGSAISAMSNYIMIFAVVKTTPTMFLNLGTDGTFLTYGVLCFVGTSLLFVYLPETKDKPLHVIEDYFKKKSKPLEADC